MLLYIHFDFSFLALLIINFGFRQIEFHHFRHTILCANFGFDDRWERRHYGVYHTTLHSVTTHPCCCCGLEWLLTNFDFNESPNLNLYCSWNIMPDSDNPKTNFTVHVLCFVKMVWSLMIPQKCYLSVLCKNQDHFVGLEMVIQDHWKTLRNCDCSNLVQKWRGAPFFMFVNVSVGWYFRLYYFHYYLLCPFINLFSLCFNYCWQNNSTKIKIRIIRNLKTENISTLKIQLNLYQPSYLTFKTYFLLFTASNYVYHFFILA